MKFRFFTNISHELRTPLTLIITPLDMVIRRLTDDAMKKQLNTIYKNAQNLLSLVNQLLDFRKLEMKGERLHLMNGDMEEFIVSAYNNHHLLSIIHDKLQPLGLARTETLISFHEAIKRQMPIMVDIEDED